MASVSGGLSVTGGLIADSFSVPAGSVVNASVASGADIDPAKLAQRPLAKYFLDFSQWRVWDAFHTPLPSAGANDDLGMTSNSYGTFTPVVIFTQISNTTATRKARFFVSLPPEYDPGTDIQIRFEVWRSNAAEVSMTIDLQAHRVVTNGGATTDPVTTTAININAAENTTADFEFNTSGLTPGMVFDCLVTIAINDTGGGGADCRIWMAYLCCDTRG